MINLILPLAVLLVLLYGIKKKVNVYDVFIEGSKESFQMILEIFPCLLAMLLAINILLDSGILSIISKEANIIAMMLMRPLSGNASLGILNNIYKTAGPDSFIGYFSSIIQATSDTTFYVITLYFGSIGIKKIRYAFTVCIIADFVAIVISYFIAKLFF